MQLDNVSYCPPISWLLLPSTYAVRTLLCKIYLSQKTQASNVHVFDQFGLYVYS